MSQYQTVTYEIKDSVATVKLNRPNELNSFNQQLSQELTSALLAAAQDSSVRAVVLGGHGRVFSAGADLKAGMPNGETVSKMLREIYKPGLLAMAEMDKPVISAVQGSAVGIGLSYALAADLVIMADTAFFLSPFANIGLMPDGGLSWLLPPIVGYQRAFQMAIECDRIPASRCLELGLANRVVPEAELQESTQAWARSLAQRAPLALAFTKRAMRRAQQMSFGEMIDYEAELQPTCIESQDCREGIAAFLAKRKPNFTGS